MCIRDKEFAASGSNEKSCLPGSAYWTPKSPNKFQSIPPIPAMKSHIETFMREYVRSTGKMLQDLGKMPAPPKGLEEILKFDNLQINIANWKCLELMFQGADNEEAMACMARMRASIFQAPIGTEFITGDQPVSLFHPTITATDPVGVGIVSDGVEITLPLSKNKLLRLDHEQGPDKEVIATADQMIEFNRRTIVMANRFIYAGYCNDDLVQRVHGEKDSFAGFVFDTLSDGENFMQVHRFIPVGPARK